MSWWEALLLGILQGLTEYLPVSSSGHLTILQDIMGLQISNAAELEFDVIVHVATVLSTIVILWKEIEGLFKGTFTTLKWNEEKNYVAKILVSMIPVFIVGMFFKDYVEAIFGSGLTIVGVCLLITALLLAFSYFAKPRQREDISYGHAFVIGIAQAIAVLPGLSRSGSTIATGLLLGDKKEKLAQFSFLMVIPPVLGEALLDVKDMFEVGVSEAMGGISPLALIVGFLAAFITGCFACKWMINLVKKGKLVWFAVYCAIVGILAIIFA